jgi:hypothetical protein
MSEVFGRRAGWSGVARLIAHGMVSMMMIIVLHRRDMLARGGAGGRRPRR